MYCWHGVVIRKQRPFAIWARRKLRAKLPSGVLLMFVDNWPPCTRQKSPGFFFTAWDCSVTSWPSKAALQRTLGAIFWVEEYATDEALITEVQNRTKTTDSKQLHSRKLVFIVSSLWSREMVKLKGLRDKICISAVYKKLNFKNIGTTWEWNDGKECFRQMRLGSKQV